MRLANAGALLVIISLAVMPSPALADKPIIVGNGTVASCTEAALKSALLVAEASGGGTVRFRCGPGPVTITLRSVTWGGGFLYFLLALPNNTTIDGGGSITLDGSNTATVILVPQGITAALKNLTITNGFTFEFDPGGINNFGTLTIKNCTISENYSANFAGAIANEATGTLTIHDSTIANNVGNFGGAILNRGLLTIRRTTFADNINFLLGGGGILNVHTLTINDSSFLRNWAADGYGGAIYTGYSAVIANTLFDENRASRGGGAIIAFGNLDVNSSTFARNVASGTAFTGAGGAIWNLGTTTAKNSAFWGNAGASGGGVYTTGALKIKNSVITQNTARLAGGGIYVCVNEDFFCPGTEATLHLKDTIVTGNTPDDIFP